MLSGLSLNAYQPTMKFLRNVSVGSYITVSGFSVKTGLDYSECVKVLDELSENGVLAKMFAVRCPECGLLLETAQSVSVAIGTLYCANCDKDYDIFNDFIEVVFKVVNSFYAE